ncbi:type IV secretion system protein [uncultured Sulfitobacter sp.]|jgi:type IV secretion system protein VirB6|uniref:type IV secretion system protein n=1 Tax=uncultured Sulfitobacter sp. TaxID=191468 RepID=UPI0030F7E20E|tara:strand:- start:17742 stop:18749 length:1008 start_codon:yes stop_codon:yes gene_type:complete
MAVIEDVLSGVDATVASIGADAFEIVAGSVVPVFQVAAVLVVALTGINLAIQAIPMTVPNGISLMLRIVVVAIFLTSFNNFFAVYDAITEAPSRFGATILEAVTGGGVADLYDGLDNLYSESLDVGNAISANGSYLAGAIAGVVMFLISALMATISIIVIAAAKLMIGVLIIIAPLAIVSTMFKQSAPFFEAYVKLALGFALVPMLAAAMAGFTIATAVAVTPSDMSTVETIGDMVSFIVVMMLGAGLMLMVPSIAQSLAQTGIGLGAIAFSTYAQGKAFGYGVASTTDSSARFARGATERAMGKPLARDATAPRRAGFASTNTVISLAQRMQRE